MAVAAKSFGRRPRDEQGADSPVSVGAELELLRALNWFIRADVPWATERDQVFDYVLVGEPGVFAMWVGEDPPHGVAGAALELGRLLGGVRVRPVVCRRDTSLASADSTLLYCTPDTALDLMVGFAPEDSPEMIRETTNRLRELVVPEPPEPVVEPEPAPKPVAKPRPVPPPPTSQPVEPVQAPPVEVEHHEPVDETPSPGKHRSERRARVLSSPRRNPSPSPSVEQDEPSSALLLPTALAPAPERRRGGNEAAERFGDSYVYAAESVKAPSAIKKEFRAKPFLLGIAVLLVVAVAAGVVIKQWPALVGLAHTDKHPAAVFGQSVSVATSNFHPPLTLVMGAPQKTTGPTGKETYAVTLEATNEGDRAWQLPPLSDLVMVDSLGTSQSVVSVSGPKKWTGSLPKAQRWNGKLVFTLRAGRSPSEVRIVLTEAGDESITWHR